MVRKRAVLVMARLRRLVVRRSTAQRDLDALFEDPARLRSVEAAEVARVLAAHEAVAAAGARERVYREYLRGCLVDHRLTEHELADLQHLRAVLVLDEAVVALVHRRVAREVYSRSVEEVVADGHVDEAERQFLTGLRERLEIPEVVAENILDMKARQRRAREDPVRARRGP